MLKDSEVRRRVFKNPFRNHGRVRTDNRSGLSTPLCINSSLNSSPPSLTSTKQGSIRSHIHTYVNTQDIISIKILFKYNRYLLFVGVKGDRFH